MRIAGMIAVVVLCVCATSSGTISLVGAGGVVGAKPQTLVYDSTDDLDTVIDPPTGSSLWDLPATPTCFGNIDIAAFRALDPKVIGFNSTVITGAMATQIGRVVANYSATDTVTFAFPPDGSYTISGYEGQGYNCGGANSPGTGRKAFSGDQPYYSISVIPAVVNGATYWFDATITTTGGRGVTAIGFCVAARSTVSTPACNAIVTLSDESTPTFAVTQLGGGGTSLFFVSYQAPPGKTITRIQIPDLGSVYQTGVIDDLSFVMEAGVPPLIGDINHDGFVNVGDLQALVAAWGSQETPPSSNWNADADINDDGFVNVGDLQLLVAHWGEHL